MANTVEMTIASAMVGVVVAPDAVAEDAIALATIPGVAVILVVVAVADAEELEATGAPQQNAADVSNKLLAGKYHNDSCRGRPLHPWVENYMMHCRHKHRSRTRKSDRRWEESQLV